MRCKLRPLKPFQALRAMPEAKEISVPETPPTAEEKISPAFKSFLAEAGPQDRREGIVVYKTSKPTETPVRGNILEIRRRLAQVRARAAGQKKAEAELFEGVQKLGKKAVRGEAITFAGIGGKLLPIA